MKKYRLNYINYFLFWLFIISSYSICFGQNTTEKINCESKILEEYTDSLWLLLINYQPSKVLQIADSILMENKDQVCPKLIRIESLRGHAYEFLFEYEKSIKIYNNLLKKTKKHQFVGEEINLKISLARVYEIINRPENCEQYLNEARQLFDPYEDKKLESQFCVRFASYHRIYKDKEVAKQFALRAIELGEESGRINSMSGGNLILAALSDDINESINYNRKASH